jgi:hypothetical protein
MTHLAIPFRTPADRAGQICRGFLRLLLVAGITLALVGTSLAQDDKSKQPARAASPSEAVPSKGAIQYLGPDTYILLDAQGRPQPMPGMTYEDFLAAWKKMNEAANPESQPRFSIESIKIGGESGGQRAELKFDITVHALAAGAINVPLGLVGAVLDSEPSFGRPQVATQPAAAGAATKGKPHDEYLDFDPQRGGFVAHLVATEGERRTISFQMIAPLVRDGAETSLALNFPRATSSILALNVDGAVSEARASSGVLTSKKSDAEHGTHIEVVGPSGQFRLSWQSENSEAAPFSTVLNAVGAIHVTIDGRGVRSDAHLSIRSYGRAFDQFRVRLPRGAKLIRDPATGSQDQKYRISEEIQSAANVKSAGNEAAIVLVQLKEKQQGPVVVDLSTEQPGHDPTQTIELGGFEVLGAVRQFGDIALTVANDWQARWNAERDIRQIDPSELDTLLQRSELTAAFQYDRQPWSLPVRVSPRKSRVHVTPQYELELRPEEARLNVRLTYQNFGARTYEFFVDVDGWDLSSEPIDSAGLIDQDRVDLSKGKLKLPFSQASSGKVEVTLALRHPLQRGASMIKLALPVPQADSVATGSLTLRAPADTELLPDLTQSTGLAAATASETAPPADADTPTELHFRSLLPNATLVVKRSNRSREASAQIATQAEIFPGAVDVDERIDYLVRFAPIKELFFEVPSNFPIDDEGAEFAILTSSSGISGPSEQRTPLHVEQVTDENDLAGAETMRLRATLPLPQIGKFSVSARYRVETAQSATTGSAVELPLAMPIEARITQQRASVRAPNGALLSLAANSDASSWKPAGEGRAKNGTGYEFEATRGEPTLPLTMSSLDATAPSATVVDRVWLQTWIAPSIEQDRAAFHIRSSNSQATIELPPDAPSGEVEVLVDGQTAQVASRAAGRIVVRLDREHGELAEGARGEPIAHTLEVRFRRPLQQSLVTRHRLTPPQVDATSELSQVYWQVILPADQHVIGWPSQLTSASEWQWLGAFWGQSPSLSQADLEKWAGASAQIGPATSDNQYLFSGLLPVASIELVTAPRWLIVLAASALAMALVLGWYYLPVRRQSWALVAIAVVIAAAAISYPTAAVLIAQAAAIGVVLATISVFALRTMRGSSHRSLAPSITPSSRRILTPRTDSIVMPAVVAAASTAPTVTLRTSDSER